MRRERERLKLELVSSSQKLHEALAALARTQGAQDAMQAEIAAERAAEMSRLETFALRDRINASVARAVLLREVRMCEEEAAAAKQIAAAAKRAAAAAEQAGTAAHVAAAGKEATMPTGQATGWGGRDRSASTGQATGSVRGERNASVGTDQLSEWAMAGTRPEGAAERARYSLLERLVSVIPPPVSLSLFTVNTTGRRRGQATRCSRG